MTPEESFRCLGKLQRRITLLKNKAERGRLQILAMKADLSQRDKLAVKTVKELAYVGAHLDFHGTLYIDSSGGVTEDAIYEYAVAHPDIVLIVCPWFDIAT